MVKAWKTSCCEKIAILPLREIVPQIAMQPDAIIRFPNALQLDLKQMKLIGSLTSPYVRKARIVLAEKKIEYDFEIDSPWNADSNVPNVNPLGKIPALILDDETVLFDSRVIVEYLDNVTPNNKLMPAPEPRAHPCQALGGPC